MEEKLYGNTIIIGRLGSNPVDYGDTVMFPILNSTLKNGEERIESRTVIVFGKQKGLVLKHLKRGSLCCIGGKVLLGNKISARTITFLR